jgi:glutaredoxin
MQHSALGVPIRPLLRRWVNTTKVLEKELVLRPMLRTPSFANLPRDRASKLRNVGIMDQMDIQLFVSHPSWHSWRAQRLLSRKGYSFKVVDTTEDAEVRGWLAHFAGRASMPYLFVDHRPVGASGRLWP